MPSRKASKSDHPELRSIEVPEHNVVSFLPSVVFAASALARIANWAVIVVLIVPIVVEHALFFWKPPPPAWMGPVMRVAFWLFDKIDRWDERRSAR